MRNLIPYQGFDPNADVQPFMTSERRNKASANKIRDLVASLSPLRVAPKVKLHTFRRTVYDETPRQGSIFCMVLYIDYFDFDYAKYIQSATFMGQILMSFLN